MHIHRYTERALGEQNGIVHTSTAGATIAKRKVTYHNSYHAESNDFLKM